MSIRSHLALLAGMAAMAMLTEREIKVEPDKVKRIEALSKATRDASFSVEQFNRVLRGVGAVKPPGLDPKPTRRYRHNKRG